MSRIGKHRVVVPSDVRCSFSENVIRLEKNGMERFYNVPSCINVERDDNGIILRPLNLDKVSRSCWGTTQRNLVNIIKGLKEGFKIEMELVGVGYKASVNGTKLLLQLGFSHDIEYEFPMGITIECPKPTSIVISGNCKKLVGDVAAVLRSYRKPEPYKGKGIMKSGEFLYRKEGKKK